MALLPHEAHHVAQRCVQYLPYISPTSPLYLPYISLTMLRSEASIEAYSSTTASSWG